MACAKIGIGAGLAPTPAHRVAIASLSSNSLPPRQHRLIFFSSSAARRRDSLRTRPSLIGVRASSVDAPNSPGHSLLTSSSYTFTYSYTLSQPSFDDFNDLFSSFRGAQDEMLFFLVSSYFLSMLKREKAIYSSVLKNARVPIDFGNLEAQPTLMIGFLR